MNHRRNLNGDTIWHPLWKQIRVRKFQSLVPLLYGHRNSVQFSLEAQNGLSGSHVCKGAIGIVTKETLQGEREKRKQCHILNK